MGVPRLLHHLQPHAERAPLDGATVVIDGPALAYHLAGLCPKSPTSRHPLDHVSYDQLGQKAVAWLDELCRHKITIRALYFDGYLPLSKRPVRLGRVHQVSSQLQRIYESYQSGKIPGFDATGYGAVPPAFIVPAVLDALLQSDVYGPLTHLVPGEADTFCAEDLSSGGGGTVLTSDSDLLVQDLGPCATVVFLQDIDLWSTEATSPLLVKTYSRAAVCQRLGLHGDDAMSSFAFELFMDSHETLGELVRRANSGRAVSVCPEAYAEFLSSYASPGALAVSASKLNLNVLDPRVSEVALQCLFPPTQEHRSGKGETEQTSNRVFVFLPLLLESWTRSTAWDASAPLRKLAFSLLQGIAGHKPRPHIYEYVRVTTLSSCGSRLKTWTSGRTLDELSSTEALIQKIRARIAHPILQWVVLSAYQEIEWSGQRSKESVCLAALREASADGTLGSVTWNALHWLAEIQGTLYSLRILQQLLGFIDEAGTAGQVADLDETQPKRAGLRQLLSSVPPIAAWPTLHTMQSLPAQLKEAGALTFLEELADLRSAILFQPPVTAIKTKTRSRKNKGRNSRAANALAEVRQKGVPQTRQQEEPFPSGSLSTGRSASATNARPRVHLDLRLDLSTMYLPRSMISKLYLHLQNTRHPLSPPVLLLVALEPDALSACRILTHLLKHDYIPHKIQPVAGYADLSRIGRELVAPMMQTRGGNGGVVVCLGVGGTVDLASFFGLDNEEDDADGEQAFGGVEVWVFDAHRPWNLTNLFGGFPLEPAPSDATATPNGSDAQALALPSSSAPLSSRTPPGINGGRVERAYKPGKGGIIVFDDGDIEDDLGAERDAYLALADMPDIEDDGEDLGDGDLSESEEDDDEDNDGAQAKHASRNGQKRKLWLDDEEEDSEDDDRPRQRRRSNSSSPIPESPRPKSRPLISLRDSQPSSDGLEFSDVSLQSDSQLPNGQVRAKKGPSARTLRRRLLRLREEKEAILRKHYRMGTSYSEPISSMAYSLASELGREDNDLLWLTIVGVTSMELYGRSSAGVAVSTRGSEGSNPAITGWMGVRGARIRQLLRDEVRRLNPPETGTNGTGASQGGGSGGRGSPELLGVIPMTARSPEDTSIRLSPEPKFLLIRHWSLYDSMLHSPYLFSRLKMWSETGLKRLHKLFAKMGVSLVQCRQSYAHMDMMLKRELRMKLLKYASMYNLDGMVPTIDTDGKDRAGAKDGWGFVRSWGWRATLSAQDVAVVIGALLEVGKNAAGPGSFSGGANGSNGNASNGDAVGRSDEAELDDADDPSEEWVPRFWEAYDALESIEALKAGLPTAKFLHRAIFNTGTALIKKKQITHLHAFRMCIVKDGPDASVFNHPGALTKLALWVGEALAEQEKDATGGRLAHGGRGTPLVVASLNEKRGVYVVVGTGGGGGPDRLAQHRETTRKKQEARAAKAKLREDRRRARQAQREEARERRRQQRAAAGEGAEDNEGDEDEEEEDDGSDSDSDSDGDSDSDMEEEADASRDKGFGLNRFGTAFQDVVAETNARVRIDSFEHCVVEVKKEDLGGFLESLSMKAVVG